MMDNGESQELCFLEFSDLEGCLPAFLKKPDYDSFKQIPKRNQTTEIILKAIDCEPNKPMTFSMLSTARREIGLKRISQKMVFRFPLIHHVI